MFLKLYKMTGVTGCEIDRFQAGGFQAVSSGFQGSTNHESTNHDYVRWTLECNQESLHGTQLM